METPVKRSARSPTRIGRSTSSATSSRHGNAAGSKLARPIATWARAASPWASSSSSISTTPPRVSTLKRLRRVPPLARRKRAKMRSPLPDFSASLPSGL